jgi:hypothetical protein
MGIHTLQRGDFYQRVQIAATTYAMFELVYLGCTEMRINPQNLTLNPQYDFSKFNQVENALRAKKLPTQHIEAAENFFKKADATRLRDFKIFCKNQEQPTDPFISIANPFTKGGALTLVAAAVGGVCKSQLRTTIEEAHKATGRECSDLNNISSANPSVLTASNVHNAGQCIVEQAEREQFYRDIEQHTFVGNACMAAGCVGMTIMIVSAIIASTKALSGRGKN